MKLKDIIKTKQEINKMGDDIANNIPCRLIFESIFEPKDERIWGSRCIGFGHFMKDKFVFTDDFAKVNE